MNPIDLPSFQRITATHGQAEGAAYFDAEESLTHDIFHERILFQTHYLDYRSYEVDVTEGAVRVRKTRLDNYKRGHQAQVVADDMDDEDWSELGSLWQRLSRDLAGREEESESDKALALCDLYYCLFDEERAQALTEDILSPSKERDWAWKQLQAALFMADQMATFEWKEWASHGVDEVNALAPLRQLGVTLPKPDAQTLTAVNRADDWERALLQYFNAQLQTHDLKLLAIGTHFDEYQTFACLPMNGLGLANALEIMGRLGIVYKF